MAAAFAGCAVGASAFECFDSVGDCRSFDADRFLRRNARSVSSRTDERRKNKRSAQNGENG